MYGLETRPGVFRHPKGNAKRDRGALPARKPLLSDGSHEVPIMRSMRIDTRYVHFRVRGVEHGEGFEFRCRIPGGYAGD